MTGFLGPFHSDNWDSAKALSSWAWPRPLGGPRKAQAGGTQGRAPTPPSPQSELPQKLGVSLPRRAPCDCAAAGTSAPRALRPGQGAHSTPCTRTPATPEALAPREAGGYRSTRGRRVGGRKEDLQPLGGGSRGSGGGGGSWRRRQKRRRRCPGTPPPIVPSPRQARPAPRTMPRAPGVQPALTLQHPAVPLLAKATYPGKARAGPGSEPTDKK